MLEEEKKATTGKLWSWAIETMWWGFGVKTKKSQAGKLISLKGPGVKGAGALLIAKNQEGMQITETGGGKTEGGKTRNQSLGNKGTWTCQRARKSVEKDRGGGKVKVSIGNGEETSSQKVHTGKGIKKEGSPSGDSRTRGFPGKRGV